MSPTQQVKAGALLTPVLEEGIRSVNFFNGRLLTAEDMLQEQDAQLKGRRRLGQALGDGIAYGLDVSPGLSGGSTPTVVVKPGLAVNRQGATLVLGTGVELSLVKPAAASAATQAAGFKECKPTTPTVYLTGEDVYLLVLAPASTAEGRASASGLGNGSGACMTKSVVEAVQFRLLALGLTPADLSDTARLRNRLAYLCFGVTELQAFQANPSGPDLDRYGALDKLRPNNITDCDVPLALIYWTDEGVQFADMWSVRREITGSLAPLTSGTTVPVVLAGVEGHWTPLLGARRASEMQAILLQFQDHLAAIRAEGASITTLAAADRFVYLPPAGYLPVSPGNFNWRTFLGPHAPPAETLVDEGVLRAILLGAYTADPARVGQTPLAAYAVYRSAADSKSVLFARTVDASLRLTLSPAPAAGDTVAIDIAPAQSNLRLNPFPGEGGVFGFAGLAPGLVDITATVTGYQPAQKNGVGLIGGRVNEAQLTLKPLPNGSLLLTITDLAGTNIGGRVSSVKATGKDAKSLHNTVRIDKTGQWLFGSLPPDLYTVTVVAANFKTGTLADVSVPRGQQVLRTIGLTPEPAAEPQPPKCVVTSKIEKPPLGRVRLCMVLKASEFSDGFFEKLAFSQYETFQAIDEAATDSGEFLAVKGTRALAPSEEAVRIASAKTEKAGAAAPEYVAAASYVSDKYYIAKPGKAAGPIVSDEPWLKMMRIDPLPGNVEEWLAAWQKWFDSEFPVHKVAKAVPAIFMNPEYKSPKSADDVPKTPQAYAVFGDFGVPLTITPEEGWTRREVVIEKKTIPGVSEAVVRGLEEVGITGVDEVVGAWGNLLDAATGQPSDYNVFLVEDAVTAVAAINERRTYYDGVDPEVAPALAGYTDDKALAGESLDVLADKVGSKGFANRIITQAKEVVARQAQWQSL